MATTATRTLQLEEEEAHQYEQITQRILHKHLREYDAFVGQRERILSRHKWKPIKTQQNLTVYQKVLGTKTQVSQTASNASTRTGVSSTDSWSSGSSEENAVPDSMDCGKLAMVGTIVGTMEDALYGMLAPDMDAMKIRTAYFEDPFTDWRVFPEIKGPTKQNPFQYLGLKSMVKPLTGPNMSVMLAPREFVFVEAVGVHVTANGDRVGYAIIHSVDEPDATHTAKPKAKHGTVRAKTSACYLMKQLPKNTVDVYARSFFDAGGHATDRMVVMRVTHTFLSTNKWVCSAHNKKLAWLIRASMNLPDRKQLSAGSACPRNAIAVESQRNEDDSNCSMCGKGSRMFRSLTSCGVCDTLLCGKCRIARKLHLVNRDGQLVSVSTCFCVSCITRAAGISAADIMAQEYVCHSPPPLPSATTQAKSPASSTEEPNSEPTPRAKERCLQKEGNVGAKREMRRVPAGVVQRVGAVVGDELVEVQTLEQQQEEVASIATDNPVSFSVEQLTMQLQMQQLLAAAEQTYNQMKENTQTQMK